MKNDCYKFSELITSYIDDELDARRRKKVQSHLGTCSECNDHYLSELNVKKLLKLQLPEIKAPVQLRHRIRRQLARKGSRPGFWQLIQSLFVYRPIAASAALTAIAFFALFPSFEMINKTSPLLDSRSDWTIFPLDWTLFLSNHCVKNVIYLVPKLLIIPLIRHTKTTITPLFRHEVELNTASCFI